jgi:hypothetical protein
VVISHPYDAQSGPSPRFEVLDLSLTGDLTQTGDTFELGRAFEGAIAFTPDGEIGFAVTDDGKLGVFRFDDTGSPEVVHAALEGTFYADTVTVSPSGDVLYVLDAEWRNIGGGVYSMRIGCDGTLTDETLLFEAKLPAALLFLPGATDEAILAADDAFSSPADQDVHLLDWSQSTSPAWVAGTDAFPDDEAMVGAAAVTHDGQYALLGDSCGFCTGWAWFASSRAV